MGQPWPKKAIISQEFVLGIKILWRASGAGSPTNRPGGDKTRDQRSCGPSTGGPDLQGSLQKFKKTG